MSMRERIAAGQLFTDHCEGLDADRLMAKQRMKEYNETNPGELQKRYLLLQEIFGKETKAWIEPPFYFCYGTNITMGEDCYLNFNCSFVDDTTITLGNNVICGPGVTIASVGHPINPIYRSYMYAAPVHIKDNCWIGANVTICPGVTIGENSVIGAGSVVIKDIPANCVAVGNPCKVLRSIDEHDMTCYYKDRPITMEDLQKEASLR